MAGRNKHDVFGEQITIFDLLAQENTDVAVSLFNGNQYKTYPLEAWMRRLLPDGKCYIHLDQHKVVLSPSRHKNIPESMRFCHYTIGDTVLCATGVS